MPTIAHTTAIANATPVTARGWQPLPSRPRRITSHDHATRVLAVADRNPDVLPRWGIRSPIRDAGPDPGALDGTVAWTDRTTYLLVIVPAAVQRHADVLARHHVSVDMLQRWAKAKTFYACQRSSGRRVIVRPDTLAGLMGCSERTAQRCNAAAREMGLERVLTKGRMLTLWETLTARRRGSPQRGLSTVTAFVVPAGLVALVRRVTPTRGARRSRPGADLRTLGGRGAGLKGAPLRYAPHQQEQRRRAGPGRRLAVGLVERVIFLRGCPPGRIEGQLRRFATAPHRWTTQELLDAFERVNVRLRYTAPVRARRSPWALLSWYLRQVDEVADAPGFGRAVG